MAETIAPTTDQELRDTLRWAADSGTSLEPVGLSSKRALGRPVLADHLLDLSSLSGITLYEPEELVLTVKAGTPRATLDAALDEAGQMLPCEPPALGRMLGSTDPEGSVGGLVATNIAGPRRFKAGSVRDFVIGVTGVSGFGEAFKSGGRVMKNVSGYDLSKLMTGSFGTLAALTEISLKVLPKPETAVTLVVFGEDPAQAVTTLAAAASSPFEPSGLAYLPAEAAALSAVAALSDAGGAATLVRIEGPHVSLGDRVEGLKALKDAEAIVLDAEQTAAAWAELRDAVDLLPADKSVWRLSIAPADAPRVIEQLRPAAWFADWAGGLLWIVPGDGAGLPTAADGHAMLIRAPDEMRRTLPFINVSDDGLLALSRRLKNSFDPKGILNPGRMYEGI